MTKIGWGSNHDSEMDGLINSQSPVAGKVLTEGDQISVYLYRAENAPTPTPTRMTRGIIYQSTNGTALGSASEEHQYGESVTLVPQTFDGYETPSAVTITWDSQSDYIFEYTPKKVDNPTKSGVIESNPNQYLQYSLVVELGTRTATSIQVRFIWTTTIKAGYKDPYRQSFYASAYMPGTPPDKETQTGEVTVVAFNEWGNPNSPERSKTASSNWITVPLTDASTSTLTLYVYYSQYNYHNEDVFFFEPRGTFAHNVELYNWIISIPKY